MRNRGKKLLLLSVVCAFSSLGVLIFFLFTALVLEPNWIVVERVVIEDQRLSGPLAGMTIAQISDLHLAGSLGFREKELVRKLNRLAPDIILITGDLVEEPAPDLVGELVKKLRPRIWTYAILGNSDRIYLKQEGLPRSYERHQELPQPASTTAQAPHEEWELDARGYEKGELMGQAGPLLLAYHFQLALPLSWDEWQMARLCETLCDRSW